MSDPSPILRFDVFELDSGAGELRRNGDRIKLPPQPFKVLELLARRSGEVLTRNEIRERVWSDDTFVDFEQGLNFCIRLNSRSGGRYGRCARFVETLPRRGLSIFDSGGHGFCDGASDDDAANCAAVSDAAAGCEHGFSGVQFAGRFGDCALRFERSCSEIEPGCIAICKRNIRPEDDCGGSGCRPDRDGNALLSAK